jgi:lipoic acid synthetase
VKPITVWQPGLLDYDSGLDWQERLAMGLQQGRLGESLILLQHTPVITIGRGGGWEDILASPALLERADIVVRETDRGGKATYHGPGQLVAYPIMRVEHERLYEYVYNLEQVVIDLLAEYGISAGRFEEHPGVWVADRKIAAVGLAIHGEITHHGLALNVAPNMEHFELLVPCGIADRGAISMQQVLGRAPDFDEVTQRFAQHFARIYRRSLEFAPGEPPRGGPGHPDWLHLRVSQEAIEAVAQMEALLAGLHLHTVCQGAHCPNVGECFLRGTATFMILGDHCTRGCRFCAVEQGRQSPPDPDEPRRVAEAVVRLGLTYVVVTSVTRDDLPDGGAGHFAATVQAIRQALPDAAVELLIPDLRGSVSALGAVVASRPEVINHNVETVPRLYPRVRPRADYRRSLDVLRWIKRYAPHIVTKSGLMLGLGETVEEVLGVMYDLRRVGCDILTLGQYLQPTEEQLEVVRYVPPHEFAAYKARGIEMGFQAVAAGPLVRSSYRAAGLVKASLPPAVDRREPAIPASGMDFAKSVKV